MSQAVEDDWKKLQEMKIRKFSSCCAFEKANIRHVDRSGKDEPRIFSTAKPEIELHYTDNFEVKDSSKIKNPDIVLHVETYDQALAAIESPANIIAMPMDVAAKVKFNKAMVSTPRVITDLEMEPWIKKWLEACVPYDVPIEINNPGLLAILKEKGYSNFIAGYSFNILNQYSAEIIKDLGIHTFTLSFESDFKNLALLTESVNMKIYVPAHGMITTMLVDYCLAHEYGKCNNKNHCQLFSKNWKLKDISKGYHSLYKEYGCRMGISAASDLCILPWLHEFLKLNIHGLKLDLRLNSASQITNITNIYNKYIKLYQNNIVADKEQLKNDIKELADCSSRPLGPGAYIHGCFNISMEGKALEKILVGAATHS